MYGVSFKRQMKNEMLNEAFFNKHFINNYHNKSQNRARTYSSQAAVWERMERDEMNICSFST